MVGSTVVVLAGARRGAARVVGPAVARTGRWQARRGGAGEVMVRRVGAALWMGWLAGERVCAEAAV